MNPYDTYEERGYPNECRNCRYRYYDPFARPCDTCYGYKNFKEAGALRRLWWEMRGDRA